MQSAAAHPRSLSLVRPLYFEVLVYLASKASTTSRSQRSKKKPTSVSQTQNHPHSDLTSHTLRHTASPHCQLTY